MSKQTILLAVFLLASFALCGIQTQPATAQSATPIHILPDGSIEPSNAPLQVDGNIYKATANLNTPIIVEKSNLVLDGQGFTIQGASYTNNQAAINLTCIGVTVKNFVVANWQVGVLGVFDNNQIIGNQFQNNNQDIAVYGNNYRIAQNFVSYIRIQASHINIEQNEVHTHGYVSAFWISQSRDVIIQENNLVFTNQTASFISTDNNSTIQVYHNNFLSQLLESRGQFYLFGMSGLSDLEPWDDGYFSGGNYWSDFTARYSNASVVDNSGIWNTGYLIQTDFNATLVDRYPLYNPYEIQVASLPTPPLSESPAPSIPEFSVWAVALLFAAILFVIFSSKKGIMGKPMGTVFA